jgi:hypothetical protein
VPDEHWRILFHRPWEDPDTHRGFALVSDGRVVGFCGAVGSDRVVDGRSERLLNLSTWVVDDAFRGHALRLLTPFLSMPDVTLTDLSASPEVLRWLHRWRFTPVPTGAVVTARTPVLVGRPWRRPWITADPAEVVGMLSGEERRLVADHLAVPGCGALAVRDRGGRCGLVYVKVSRGTPNPYAHVLYAGDPVLLGRHAAAVANAVAGDAGVRFVAFDERMLGGRLPLLSWRMPLGTPWLVRSERVDPRRVDVLYSEVALLGQKAVIGLRPGGAQLRDRLGLDRGRATTETDTDTTTRSGG